MKNTGLLESVAGHRRTGRTTVLLRGVLESDDDAFNGYQAPPKDNLRRRIITLAEYPVIQRQVRAPIVFDHRVIENELHALEAYKHIGGQIVKQVRSLLDSAEHRIQWLKQLLEKWRD